VAVIPIRLHPLPGEALDSWLETYAHLLHVAVRDIFALAGVDWDRVASEAGSEHKLWLYQLDEPFLAALSAVSGIPAATLAGMTLASYEGTGLATVTAAPSCAPCAGRDSARARSPGSPDAANAPSGAS
jgi:TniQ